MPVSGEPGQTHDHPKLADGRHDLSQMRPCAGYVAQRLGGILQRRAPQAVALPLTQQQQPATCPGIHLEHGGGSGGALSWAWMRRGCATTWTAVA